jgi:hypothetical protein
MFGFFKNPSREKFAQMVLERIRAKTGLADLRFDPSEFSIQCGSQRIFLQNLYTDYCGKQGKDREIVLDNIVVFARSGLDTEPSFEETAPNLIAVVRERLLVSLADVNWGVSGTDDKKVSPPVSEPISRWFLRALVIDAPTHMAYVNEEHLRRWNLTFDEAWAIAFGNLRAATVPKFETEGKVHIGKWGDAYDASRVLVPGIFDDLPIVGEAVVALPNRDTLLVADSDDPAAVQAMLERAEQLVTTCSRPQNIAPLVIRDGQILDYEVPATSPVHAAVSLARGHAWLSAYGEQKAILEKVYERNGKDIYVGEHTLNRYTGNGTTEYRSHCLWARDVATLLPVADEVVFYDPQVPGEDKAVARVPWARVRARLEDLMLDTKMYPPRYYVSRFPSAGQLADLTAQAGH